VYDSFEQGLALFEVVPFLGPAGPSISGVCKLQTALAVFVQRVLVFGLTVTIARAGW